MEETQKIPIREVGAKDKEYPEKLCQYTSGVRSSATGA